MSAGNIFPVAPEFDFSLFYWLPNLTFLLRNSAQNKDRSPWDKNFV